MAYTALRPAFWRGRQGFPGSFAHSNLSFCRGYPLQKFGFNLRNLRFFTCPIEPRVFAARGSIRPCFGDRQTRRQIPPMHSLHRSSAHNSGPIWRRLEGCSRFRMFTFCFNSGQRGIRGNLGLILGTKSDGETLAANRFAGVILPIASRA